MSVELTSGQSKTMGGVDAVSYTDPLTGLGNRVRLRDKISKLIQERSLDPAPFTIGLVNLDGFRPINDLFGHAAGDDILCQVAHRLRACMPPGAVVMRLESDAFAFVLPLVFDERGAVKVSDLFKDVLSAPYDLGKRTVRLSSSFGFAIYPYAGEDYAQLMESADTALYRSKRRGRGQVTVYSVDIAEEMKRATQLEQALRRAIIADEVDVHFQPIVDISNGYPIGFEALARWHDDELGFVSPATFIPLAEERGIIEPLTETMLKKAAQAALSWPDDKFLSFNLSSAQLVDPSTHGKIMSIIQSVGLDPHRLELEITETAMMADPDIANSIIDSLRAEGVSISLDDFGTGQSSLGRLREIALDKVKIDRSFVSEITRDRPSEHIIKAIIALCDGLDLKVVAEGIETSEQAGKLLELGCVTGQGYFYGKPMSALHIQEYLHSIGIARTAV
ncbi:putative bifunctional diguanylate cyclase/phosphodiesterase [Hoeflea sp. TYP-13]|uniref:putative bifunctional diguanylate cyclase/phosphodiesterase n=1 Tax=Hoeflea sp. TYP-13 TaxID=3230023 RepID=UPI0034C6174C